MLKRTLLPALVVSLLASACALSGDRDVLTASDDAAKVSSSAAALTRMSGKVSQLTGAELDQRRSAALVTGHRPISISVYGAPGSELYAAVFVHRDGPEWTIKRGTGTASFDQTFLDMANAYFKPTKISFEGSSDNPVWAAIFEKTSGPIPYTRHALTSGDGSSSGHVQYWLKKATDEQLVPSTYAIYGSASSPRYAMVLEPNRENVAWTLGQMSFDTNGLWTGKGLVDTASEYAARFSAHQPTGARAAAISVSGDGRYAGLFRADRVGPTGTRTGLTAAALDDEIAIQEAQGLVPIAVEGHGPAASPRFAAIFAATDQPITPTFAAIGTGAPSDAAIPGVDVLVDNFMTQNGVRHASLAVLHQNKLVYARGYNRTEPGARRVTPSSYFRMGSLSKTVTAIEIMKLAEEGRFGRVPVDTPEQVLATPVQSILGLTTWDGKPPADPRFASITLEELLRHSYPSLSTDGVARCLKEEVDVSQGAAKAMGDLSLPLNTTQAVGYAMAASDLVRITGMNRCYSNLAYVLLSMVVEKLRGASFESVLWNDLFAPSHITRFRPASLDPSKADEALYVPPFLSTRESFMVPGTPLVSKPYGGDINPNVSLASGAMSMAAPDLARLLAVAATPGQNLLFDPNARSRPKWIDVMFDRSLGFDGVTSDSGRGYKGGDLAGLQAGLSWRSEEFSYVVMFGRSGLSEATEELDFYPTWTPVVKALRAAHAETLPDLFPSFGMPSL